MTRTQITGFLPMVLKRAFPRHSAKLISAATGKSPRTAQDWLQGRSQPSAADILALAQAAPAIRAFVATASDQPEAPDHSGVQLALL